MSKVLYLRVPDAIADAIDELAASTGYSKNLIADWALRRGLSLASIGDDLRDEAHKIAGEVPKAGHSLERLQWDNPDWRYVCFCGAESGGWERYDEAASAFARHCIPNGGE